MGSRMSRHGEKVQRDAEQTGANVKNKDLTIFVYPLFAIEQTLQILQREKMA